MIIGLTGQTGAGKSTLCRLFGDNGFYIIDCDKVARETTKKGRKTLLELAKAFGEDILLSDGSLDRKKLASRAFEDAEKTQLLNQITHPAIMDAIKEEIKNCNNDRIVLDAPTLIESGAYKLCDKIVSVLADKDVRLKRIIARDSISKKEAETRMSAQNDDLFYKQYSDAAIYNNSTQDSLNQDALKILSEIGVL